MRPILLAGPTASGKSAFAVGLAERLKGAVINADSQQIYSGWRVLSARPTADEQARAPHHLYGHVPMEADYSVGHWLRDLAPVLAECAQAGKRPIITGGTGLYFKALTEGLAPIPAVPPETRQRVEAEMERLGLADFAAKLAERDPDTAAVLDLDNPRRVLRAFEVLEATGTGLAGWKARTQEPLIPLSGATAVALTPPRPWLYARCEARLDTMMDEGALDEVRGMMALGLPGIAPSLRALGAPELSAHLRGELSLDEAIARAKTETRRYAKRQLTWIRNQMGAWTHVDPSAAEAFDVLLNHARSKHTEGGLTAATETSDPAGS